MTAAAKIDLVAAAHDAVNAGIAGCFAFAAGVDAWECAVARGDCPFDPAADPDLVARWRAGWDGAAFRAGEEMKAALARHAGDTTHAARVHDFIEDSEEDGG